VGEDAEERKGEREGERGGGDMRRVRLHIDALLCALTAVLIYIFLDFDGFCSSPPSPPSPLPSFPPYLRMMTVMALAGPTRSEAKGKKMALSSQKLQARAWWREGEREGRSEGRSEQAQYLHWETAEFPFKDTYSCTHQKKEEGGRGEGVRRTFSSFIAILTSTHPSQPLPWVLLYFLLMAAPSMAATVGWGRTDSAVEME